MDRYFLTLVRQFFKQYFLIKTLNKYDAISYDTWEKISLDKFPWDTLNTTNLYDVTKNKLNMIKIWKTIGKRKTFQ